MTMVVIRAMKNRRCFMIENLLSGSPGRLEEFIDVSGFWSVS